MNDVTAFDLVASLNELPAENIRANCSLVASTFNSIPNISSFNKLSQPMMVKCLCTIQNITENEQNSDLKNRTVKEKDTPSF